MSESPEPAKAIFLKAIEDYPPHEWDAFLEGACLDDPELLERVWALLRSHVADDELFDRYHIAERPGKVIGSYQLLEQIGDGGFGVVYMAEQTHPVKRKVALKVIKPGMDSKEVIARFEAERQALAMMNHPNIAKIFDGGVTERGRPYFVMELVEGVPITQFCDEKELTPRERIDVFTDVCRAIQHAHDHNIIHRDIKPSNVIVMWHEGRAVPKVIDFGVAKALGHALTDRTMFTAFGQMIGTPQYMSPEQAETSGPELDMRSDVYSLGVLLYELLTGTTPLHADQIREAALGELRRKICDLEPQKPSVRITKKNKLPIGTQQGAGTTEPLKHGLAGDLDVITMKAIEKDRHRRYASAADLVDDLERHQSDVPILARPPSLFYRLTKFARRHRDNASTVAASFGSALLLVAIISGFLAWRAAREAQQMQQRAEDAAQRLKTNN